MSLTQYVEVPEVRKKFDTAFKIKPVLSLNKPLIAVPKCNSYQLVGTAFDYLLRFNLELLNHSKILKYSWVADDTINSLEEYGLSKRQVSEVKEHFSFARKAYDEFIKNKVVSDDLIKASIRLAQIDWIYRSKRFDFSPVTNEQVEDLKQLLSIVPKEELTAKKVCILNPHFPAAMLVGGADADLIIDDTLIEIKTTQYLKLEKRVLYQLIGYYVLYKHLGIEDCKKLEIKYLAVYFSRHGLIFKFPIEELMFQNNLDFENFKHEILP